MSVSLVKLVSPPLVLTHNREDAYTAGLDPLSADPSMQLLPTLNEQRDTVALVLMLVDLLPYMSVARGFDVFEANAAMRDLGMLLGSLKRHGVEPVNVIPDLEDKLNLLSSITSLPPRDTLLHYTVWNPQSWRLRTYTGSEDERQLIKSVQLSMGPLKSAIYNLQELHFISIDSQEFSLKCEQVIEQYSGMVTGIVHAKRKVSPSVFATELRFYFDPITLNEQVYLGPGAVEMPVFVFDHLLWGSDCQDATYKEFKTTYVPYVEAHIRQIYADFVDTESLVTKVVKAIAKREYTSRQDMLQSVKSLIRLFTVLKSFRMPHKKLAEEAYTESEGKKREKGSGGYEPQILSHLLKLTISHLSKLEETISYMD